MTSLRKTLLGACLALPLAAAGTAMAAPPAGSRTITVPEGAVVLILPGPGMTASPMATTEVATPANDPLLRLVAEQEAVMHHVMVEQQMMMRHMLAEMGPMFADPPGMGSMNRMIEAAMHGAPVAGQGAGVVVTSVSDGHGMCSQRVVYSYPADGGTPRVTLTRSGDACAPVDASRPLTVAQPAPAAAHGPHLWAVSDPPQPLTASGSPRS